MGRRQFGAAFFSLTGLHMAHVTLASSPASWSTRIWPQTIQRNHVEITGLYWHFVDLVWMFVFPLIYLLARH